MMTTRINSRLVTILCACTMVFASEASGLSVSISVSPSTLNLGSGGMWITCSVSLPDPYTAADVVSVSLEGVSPDSMEGGGSSLTCKFDRSTFESMLAPYAPGDVVLTLTGTLADGTPIEGSDTITVKFADLVVTSWAGANGSMSPDGSTRVEYGSDLGFTASPDPGYEVDEWYVDGSDVQTGGTSFTLSNITVNQTVNVTFKRLQYTVTASAGTGGSVSPESATVEHGGSLTFTATPLEGYEVDQWSGGGQTQNGGTSFTLSNITSNQSISVTFKRLRYTVSASAGTGGSVDPEDAIVDHGGSITFTATPLEGYEVDQWSGGGQSQTGGTSFTLSNITANQSVSVSFKRLQYAVTASAGTGGSVSPGSATVEHGGSVTFSATPDEGYEVDHWSGGGQTQTGGMSFTLSNVTSSLNVSVTFKQLQYTVTASAGTGGSVSPESTTVLHGGSVTFSATPDDGYEVDQWSGGGQTQSGGTSFTLSNVTSNQSVSVTFRESQYTIDASAGPHGSVSPTSVTASLGSSQTFTAVPESGYRVDAWYLDGSVAQAGGTTYTISYIDADHSLRVTFTGAMAYSLGDIEFEDEDEFETRIISNNVIDPDKPENSLLLVERVVGLGPDTQNAAMWMRNVIDRDPASPYYGQIVHARAKGIFLTTAADEILIRFNYLFKTSLPGVELAVYLSDWPELIAQDDPKRAAHYLEVARLAAPPFPRPGSAGSGRWAVFEKVVWTGHLNFKKGVYVELELIEPLQSGIVLTGSMQDAAAASGDTSALIDSWNPAVQCYGICLDINWDNFVDESDFMMVIGGSGCTATGDMACMDGAFSTDGYMDSYDVVSWDWSLNSQQRLLNFCGVPLTSAGAADIAGSSLVEPRTASTLSANVDLLDNLDDLLIVGKKGSQKPSDKLKDSLYIFDRDGASRGWSDPAMDRCNIRLIQGPDGVLYLLNSEAGLISLDGTSQSVLPPGTLRLTQITEPRYGTSATVSIGIQDKGPDSFGRPVLDAAVDGQYVYVVPVVVEPDAHEPYTAAAKLRLLDAGNPPYEIVRLYDDPPPANDNQYRNNLRELELDDKGNLYVLNVHALNESDILWRYASNGTVERLDLGRPDSPTYIPAPVAMYASSSTDMLYLTSAVYNPADRDTTVISGFSTQGPLTLERTVSIHFMHHATGITEDPQTGTLWVAGFCMYNIPLYPDPTRTAYYTPCLAEIPRDSDQVRAASLSDPDVHDLAMPMSIIWTGSMEPTFPIYTSLEHSRLPQVQ
ncbi:MAG: hypothetical protein ABIF19_08050 [Planctomycetota bacterium]